MNMRYIYVVSMLIIALISIGCVDKTPEKNLSSDSQTQTNVPTTTETSNGISSSGGTDGSGNVWPAEETNGSDNYSSETIEASDNSSSETIDVSENTSSPEVAGESDIAPSPEVTDVSTEDTSVTNNFKIGEEKNVLGVNIKLVNITNYDNNSVVILINGAEYKYDSETTVQASGIEIVDIIALEEDKTAEITVDHVTQ